MSTSTSERSKAVKHLMDLGFRLQFTCPDFTVLCKPTSHSCLYIAQVNNDGYVNTKPLSEFISNLLT